HHPLHVRPHVEVREVAGGLLAQAPVSHRRRMERLREGLPQGPRRARGLRPRPEDRPHGPLPPRRGPNLSPPGPARGGPQRLPPGPAGAGAQEARGGEEEEEEVRSAALPSRTTPPPPSGRSRSK